MKSWLFLRLLSKYRCARFYRSKIYGKIFFCLCGYMWTLMIRQELENIILGEEYRYLAIETRDRLKLTQKEMGEKLYMSESSYSDIETGETNCAGTLTATLLLSMQKDPLVFLNRVLNRIDEYLAAEVLPV